LAVCAASCGPGNLHLINGLFDANRSGVPVLAIAAHIPTEECSGEPRGKRTIGGGFVLPTRTSKVVVEAKGLEPSDLLTASSAQGLFRWIPVLAMDGQYDP
jgi:hypothetical protein